MARRNPSYAAGGTRKPKYLEPDEVRRLVAATDSERDALLVGILWRTGARISEVLGVRVGHIRKRGIWLRNLKQHDVKADKVATIQDAAFLERLNEYTQDMDPNAYLFHGRFSGHLSRQRAWVIIKKAALKANVLIQHSGDAPLVAAWPHSLRHSHAIHLLNGGVPLNAVKSQLGHASLSSTAVYLELSDADRERAIAKVPF